jgi:hypothetical protein
MAMRRGSRRPEGWVDDVVEGVGRGIVGAVKKGAKKATRRGTPKINKVAGVKRTIQSASKGKSPVSKAKMTVKEAAEQAKKTIARVEADAARQTAAKANKNKIIRNARSTVRRIEVKEKIAKDPAFNRYRKEKQGIRLPTAKEKAEAIKDSRKIEGGMRNVYSKQKAKEEELLKNWRNAKGADKIKAKRRLDKYRETRGSFRK